MRKTHAMTAPKMHLFLGGVLAAALLLTVVGGTGWLFYDQALTRHKMLLSDLADSQAKLMDTAGAVPQGHTAPTGADILIGVRRNDQILIQAIPSSTSAPDRPPRQIAWTAPGTTALRHALSGERGVMTGTDPDGQAIIAAYAPLPQLGAGLVASVDLTNFRAPFFKALWLPLAVGLSVILLGLGLIWRFSGRTDPGADAMQDSRADRLQALVQAIPDAVLEISSQGIVLDGNDGAAALFNHPIAGMTGHPLADVFQDGASVADHLQTAMRERRPQSCQAQALRRGKSSAPMPLPVDISIGPWTDGLPPHATPHASVIVRDVSDWLETERQRRQAQTSEALAHLAGGVAHDFNNLLTPILALSERVGNDLPEGDRNRDRLARVMTAAKRAATLVKRVQTYDRDPTLASEPVAVEDLLRDTTQHLVSELPSTVDLTTAFHSSATILGDPSALRAVFLELISGAVDAMAAEGGTLRLALTSDPDVLDPEVGALALSGKRSWARVTVEDTGHGMTPDTLARIFDPFFTTKPPDRPPTLDLFLAKDIIVRHGGRIVASSQPGQGSVFEIYLPLFEPDPKDIA